VKKTTPTVGISSVRIDRRRFVQLTAAAVGAPALWTSGIDDASAATPGNGIRNYRETMTYRKLGGTEMVSSRLIFGGGSALAGGKGVRLLDRAFEAGINLYDLGSDIYYKGSEKSFAPFLKAHRDQLWVVSKAPVRLRIKPGEQVTVKQAKTAASQWSSLFDQSLADLDTDYVDGYSLMAVDQPELVRLEELYQAFQKAKQAGKVGYLGLSVHRNTPAVLDAAAEAGWFDFAMIGITPGGWYDWFTKDLLEGTPTLRELAPNLQRLRDGGMGLIGMKVARHLAMNRRAPGDKNETAFDGLYGETEKAWPFNPYQRSYAYVLNHGIDVVNSNMQNFTHLEENLAAVKPGVAVVESM
jgi:aryl-alcohol dehydrogenase-like predicted oxidoreductase